MRLFLRKTDLRKIQKWVDTQLNEYGGGFTIDTSRRLLTLGTVSKGNYDGIDFKRAAVEFHTHPSKCKTASECTIALLSPEDLFNIAIGRKYGVQRHLVFTATGTWSISLSSIAASAIFRSERHTYTYLSNLWHVFDELHRQFLKRRVNMRRYMSTWIAEAKKRGFDIKLFGKNEIPYVDLNLLKLSDDESLGKRVPLRHVPPKYVQFLSKLAQSRGTD